MKAAGAPSDGVGFQMHVAPRRWCGPAADQIGRNLRNLGRFAALGLAARGREGGHKPAKARTAERIDADYRPKPMVMAAALAQALAGR